MTSDPGPFISPLYFSKRYFIRVHIYFIFRCKLTGPNFLKYKVCLDFIGTEDCIQINTLQDNYKSSVSVLVLPSFSQSLYVFFLVSYSLPISNSFLSPFPQFLLVSHDDEVSSPWAACPFHSCLAGASLQADSGAGDEEGLELLPVMWEDEAPASQ